MRIAIFGASDNYGGTEAYILTFYRQMDTATIRFDFLFPHSVREIPYESEITSRGGKIYKEYYMYSERHSPDYISPKELFDRHPEWDGIYINVQKIDTTYRLLVEAAHRGLSYRIIHAHCIDVGRKTLKGKIFKAYFDLTKKKVVTHYLACSKIAGSNMFGECDLTVIPNAVDFQKFAPNQEMRKQMRNRLGVADEQRVFGFCGRLCTPKNPEMLIDIFNEIHKLKPDSRLLILGDGEKREELTERVKAYGLQWSVIFVGSVTNVEDWLQAMDCFVFPSRWEGFGIVLLEAQAAGLQCFTTKDAVPEETDLTGRVHFIRRDASPYEWAQAILSTDLRREDCMETLMKSGYTLDKMREKIMKIFGVQQSNQLGR